MKRLLFSPLDPVKWFIIGFTVWLAELTDFTGAGGNGGSGFRQRGGSLGHVYDGASDRLGEVLAGGVAAAIIAFIVIIALFFFLLFLWLSSRGQFLYLDNLVNDRASVRDPWKNYAKLGDSLFLWRLVYTLICMVSVVPLTAFAALSVLPIAVPSLPAELGVAGFIFLGSVIGVLIVIATYVDFFLLHFVVPVMYKHGLRATAAWRTFWPVLKEHAWEFVLYGLFYLVLHIAVLIITTTFGFLTCCAGFLLLLLPVVGTTILLPVHLTLRGMDLEFLAQFGEKSDLVSHFPENRPAEGNRDAQARPARG
ncbi:MAG: hypothetical protein JW958_04460 [Candidatus Eisenbacteria bacterium]|nr:hypothetical protein [Candidatus Eisenbacteria bacterium]